MTEVERGTKLAKTEERSTLAAVVALIRECGQRARLAGVAKNEAKLTPTEGWQPMEGQRG